MTQAKNGSRPLESSGRPRSGADRGYGLLLAIALLVFIADQVSKAAVTQTLSGGRFLDLFGGLIRLDYAENTGAAFGLFKSAGVLFVLVALGVAVAIAASPHRIALLSAPVRAALGLVLGGALSNAADRVRLGYVVDFIDLRWWPVFNLADSAIVVGATLLAAHSLWTSRRESIR